MYLSLKPVPPNRIVKYFKYKSVLKFTPGSKGLGTKNQNAELNL